MYTEQVIPADFNRAVFTVGLHCFRLSPCFDFFFFFYCCYDICADPEPGLIFVLLFPASLPCLSLYLSTPPSSFERLSRSLAHGSNQPLACIGQPFEVVPGRQKPCDSPRSPNRYGVQMCPSPCFSLEFSPCYYSIVWFCIPHAQPVVDTDPSTLLLTYVHLSPPQRGETKHRGEWEREKQGRRRQNPSHLELIGEGAGEGAARQVRASGVSIC